MSRRRLLVANRGEIAIRVMRAAAELGWSSVAVATEDDARCLHTRRADAVETIPGVGARGYLDADAIVEAAHRSGCDALHPGYGFLSESAGLARACATAGVAFVGPEPDALELFGDKTRARALAARCGVPVLPGTGGPTSPDEARAFLESQGDGATIALKALAGGGGRGLRVVGSPDEIEAAHEQCQREAKAFFGNGDVYAERWWPRVRHVEVQIVGDGRGGVRHLWERECTLQRRHQKLVEVAPAPGLPGGVRRRILEAAIGMAESVDYRSLGTFEFLVDAGDPDATEPDFVFIEANPRLQVEHTVTEAVTGIDLVQTQLRIADGASLDDLGLGAAEPRGIAIQVRVNTEKMTADGQVRPAGGTLLAFEPPSGPGVRVDSHGYAGYATSPRFDSLLAKLVVHTRSDDWAAALRKTERSLAEFRIEGVGTNAGFVRALLRHPEVVAGHATTRFVEEHGEELVRASAETGPERFPEPAEAAAAGVAPAPAGGVTGAVVDAVDPLAVLDHGKAGESSAPAAREDVPGLSAVRAPLQGSVVVVDVAVGDRVRRGQPLLVMEAMKMEHVVAAPVAGVVRRVQTSAGATVVEGAALVFLEPSTAAADEQSEEVAVDLDAIRPDLAEVDQRHAVGLDAARPDAVARRRKTGQRTVRENVDDLCDEGSFVEYGPLVIAAQRRRRSVEDLIERTPADGLVAGIGRVNGDRFPDADARCAVLAYDYTVLAGTQGQQNHRKKDRMFELAEKHRLPLVFFTEGGGGRPGDTDGLGVAGLDCMAFHYFGRLSGLVPLVGINSGRCFAGNAALLGCCDVVIATENSNIGMGGPAMIEGGGLGVFRPDEVGPMAVQVPNGVVDVAVEDEAEAVAVARQYLSYFQGVIPDWECADPRLLRSAIPENRLRVYDVRRVIELLFDVDSVLELRRSFGPGMVTALARMEGRPVGVVANNPVHLAGAIDSEGADKAARFMQLCDAFDLPIVFLCDTPGIMVGPESEKTALVRHASRMFVTGASLSVPFVTIILRKGYGLGAQAMAGGSFKAPFFTVAWPTGEFGGMGLEGAVKLGYRKELAAVEDPNERRALFQEMVDRMYAHGKAVNTASHFEIDDVIDPADSRRWITGALRSVPPAPRRAGKKRPCIDTW
jgi:acetyl/propionyl-CoA carboxylase alpha subunit/acetyl-CoA carboxylase carboxyltransferase component